MGEYSYRKILYVFIKKNEISNYFSFAITVIMKEVISRLLRLKGYCRGILRDTIVYFKPIFTSKTMTKILDYFI